MKLLKNNFSLLICLILISNFSINAQSQVDVNYELVDDNIHIHYTIQSDPNADYTVEVFLRRSSIPSFRYQPENVSGSIGKGKFANGKQLIVWKINDKEMEMFDGDDFYFEVLANKIDAGGGIPWYYYAGAGLAAGAAAILLGGGSDNGGNGSGTKTTEIPSPPGRPSGN